jgi:hypothetical protein
MKYLVNFNTTLSVETHNGPRDEMFFGFSDFWFEYCTKHMDEQEYLNFIENCKTISVDEFNQMKFKNDDIVIVPFFNRSRMNYDYPMIVDVIKKLFKNNLTRDNTYLILGITSESNGNNRRGNPDNNMNNEEAADLVYELIGKKNQKIKLLVDGSCTYGVNLPTDNKTKLVTGNIFLEWAYKLLLTEEYKNIYSDNISKIKRLEDRDKLFTCLQRRPRLCRFINLHNIYRHNLKDDGFYSLRIQLGPTRGYGSNLRLHSDWKIESEDFVGARDEFSEFIRDIKKLENTVIAADSVNLFENQAINLNPTHYLDSYFHVSVETLIGSDIIFFTEKIYKPIICGSPFFVLGNRGMINELQNLGFKTFNKWWDESYDDYNSHWERSKKVFSTLEELNKKPKSELNNILNEQLYILTHNYNRLDYLIKNDTYVKDIIDLIS